MNGKHAGWVAGLGHNPAQPRPYPLLDSNPAPPPTPPPNLKPQTNPHTTPHHPILPGGNDRFSGYTIGDMRMILKARADDVAELPQISHDSATLAAAPASYDPRGTQCAGPVVDQAELVNSSKRQSS